MNFQWLLVFSGKISLGFLFLFWDFTDTQCKHRTVEFKRILLDQNSKYNRKHTITFESKY